MSWNEIAEEGQYIVSLAPQSAINTPGSSWEHIECMAFSPENETSQVDTPRGAQSYGAYEPPIPGVRRRRLALKAPVKGQRGDYDPSSHTPALTGLSRFLHYLGGSEAIATQATGIELTASDANTVILKTSTGKLGCLLAAADSTGAISQGFIKALSGSGPYTATLFEDLATQMADDARRLPTLTLFPARSTPTNRAYTVRCIYYVASGGDERKYPNFLPTSMRLLVEDDVLMWEVPGIGYYPEVLGTTVPPSLTSLLGMDSVAATTRYVVASNVLGDYNDGGLDPSGTCGARDVVLNIEFPPPLLAAGPYPGGVCDIVMRAPIITVDLAVPSISDYLGAAIADTGDTVNLLLSAWANKTPVSFSAYHGNTAGKLLSYNLPSAHPIAEPVRVMLDGVEHYRATLRLGHWAGDGASPPDDSEAGCKPFRIGVG